VDGVLAEFDQGRTHWSRIWALAALGTVLRTRTGSAPGHTLKRPACTTRTPSLGKVLGLFPTTELIGGIQTSGRVAWEGLSGNGATGSATMFCYCATPRRSRRISSTSNVHVGSKLSAVTSALGRQWDADLILVWHIGLLPLVPLFRRPHAKVAVALFGVDAWREVDPLTRVLLRHSDLLISISDYTWTRFAAANPSLAGLPHTTVHLGIGGVAAPHELRPPDDRPIALMISRLSQTERYKGHHEVIQCWPDVRSQVADAELWIVGDGGLRPQLERSAGEGVRFWGTVSEQRKADLITQSRALVMPSRKEGFGLVYLEAMRLGRPCLVSTLDAGQEVIRPPEAGLAVNPADHPALTDALGRLMRMGDDWAAWSEQGRLRYEASYTARAYQDQLVSALVNVGCS